MCLCLYLFNVVVNKGITFMYILVRLDPSDNKLKPIDTIEYDTFEKAQDAMSLLDDKTVLITQYNYINYSQN